jgi:hypothetical protein
MPTRVSIVAHLDEVIDGEIGERRQMKFHGIASEICE